MNRGSQKFLIDVGVGKAVENFLNEKGFDVKTVRSINPRMKDIDILRMSVSEDRMIITMDKDFGELVHHYSEEHKGVLILRMEDARGTEKCSVIKEIIQNYGYKIQNRFCVFSKGNLRIK